MTTPKPGELVVVSGPPGSGKTTVSGLLSALFDPSVLVAGDEFFGFLRNGRVEPWLPESDAQNTTVIASAAAACGEFARGGYTVVYDGVVGPWFVGRFLSGTGLGGLHYAILLPDEEVCVERVLTRPSHPFADPDATRHMHRQFAGADAGAHHVRADADPAALARSIKLAVERGDLAYPAGDRAPAG